MKKIKGLSILLTCVLCVTMLVACESEPATVFSCTHQWNEATCVMPMNCSLCGEVQGKMLEHIWRNATCESPVMCERCGATAGDALEHIWIDATTTIPKHCAICGKTEGKPLQRKAVGIYRRDYLENGNDWYDVLQFEEGGSVYRTNWHSNDRATGTYTVSGSWKQEGLTIYFTLEEEWFEDFNLLVRGGDYSCTLTDEGVLWGYDIYKKIA